MHLLLDRNMGILTTKEHTRAPLANSGKISHAHGVMMSHSVILPAPRLSFKIEFP